MTNEQLATKLLEVAVKCESDAAAYRTAAANLAGNGNGHKPWVAPAAVPMNESTLVVPKRRKMSASARKRISEAQKARWAKQKAAAGKRAAARS